MVLWVQFPVDAGSTHTKDVKNGNGPCLHGTLDEVGTTKQLRGKTTFEKHDLVQSRKSSLMSWTLN